MRSGGETGHADQSDALTLLDALSAAYEDAREVQVESIVAVDVGDLHHVAAVAAASRERDFAVRDCLHRRSDGRGVVGAEVSAVCLQHGVETAAAEMRADARGEF